MIPGHCDISHAMNSIDLLKKKLSTFLLIRLALRHVWRSGPALMVGTSFLLLFQGLLPLLMLYLTKVVVDAITSGVSSPDKTAAFKNVLWAISLLQAQACSVPSCRQWVRLSRNFNKLPFRTICRTSS